MNLWDEVVFKIWKDGADKEKDKPVAEIKTVHEGGKAVATWKYVYVHNPDQPLTAKPKFKVEAWSFKCGKKESGTLEVGAEIDFIVIGDDGRPEKDLDYTIIQPNGEELSGKTDKDGKIKKNDLIPGEYRIKLKYEE